MLSRITKQLRVILFSTLTLSRICIAEQNNHTPNKSTIAISQLQMGGIDSILKATVVDVLVSKIQSIGIFVVIERSQADEILKEQAFQQSGACDQASCAVEVGKLLGADKIIIGSINISSGIISTNLRVINLQTGIIDKSYSDIRQGDFMALISRVLPDAAAQISGLNNSANETGGYMQDSRDGKAYKVIHVRGKTWMAENLNFSTQSSSCYNNDTSLCKIYGNYYTDTEAIHACPQGWHLSTDKEWMDLELEIGIPSEVLDRGFFWQLLLSRGAVSGRLRDKKAWNESEWARKHPEYVPPATDDIGFKSLPGGLIKEGKSLSLGDGAFYWSTKGDTEMCERHMIAMGKSILRLCLDLKKYDRKLNIRCVQDSK